MPTRVKGRQGEELSAYLPVGKIAELDEVRGPYLSRSKFVLLALDKAIKEARSGTLRIESERERNTSTLGVSVSTQPPNVSEDSGPTTAAAATSSTPSLQEEAAAAGVS